MPPVLRPYRELLATPGGLRFSTAAFVARMPISMLGLGVVLLVVSETGRYGRAGALSATFALAEAAGAPLVSRLVDQRGQSTVLVPAVAVHLVALTAFIVLASADGPPWTQFLTAALAGLTLPSMGSLVRARWGFVLGDDPRLHTAYAYESVLDELIFVVGPLLVTVIATTLAPQVALFVAARAAGRRHARRCSPTGRASRPCRGTAPTTRPRCATPGCRCSCW